MIFIIGKLLPGFTVGRWTPDSWLDQVIPGPMATAIRLPGGHMDIFEGYDECLLQVAITTGTPEDSNQAMSLLRAVLCPIEGMPVTMPDGYQAYIHWFRETSGPQMLTVQQHLDMRVIPATFRVRVGMKNRTRYDDVLRAISNQP